MKLIGILDHQHIVAFTTAELEAYLDFLSGVGGSPTPSVLPDVVLPYPHVSQLDATARYSKNDCAIAATLSVMKPQYPELTVDELSKEYQVRHTPMQISDVMKMLADHHYGRRFEGGTTTEMIEEHLRAENKPVIALVSYRALPYKSTTYHWSHFITIYGVLSTGEFLYHDPLADDRKLSITPAQLKHALLKTNTEGNQPNQSIFVL